MGQASADQVSLVVVVGLSWFPKLGILFCTSSSGCHSPRSFITTSIRLAPHYFSDLQLYDKRML